MIPLTAEEAGEALGLEALSGQVEAVSIDTRTMRPGDLFVALRGECFDGHAFVGQALVGGASGVVVDEGWWDGGRAWAGLHTLADTGTEALVDADPSLRARVYPVNDTLEALGALARAVRRKSGAKVIAVTGSVGKTGTKDLITAMARRVSRVVSTSANQNNEIGVPLTLLSIEPDTQVAVVEMGMRGPGQIAALVNVAEPDVGVITSIHPVHLELLGSMESIAEAKAELILGLESGCTAVVPAGCAAVFPHLGNVRGRVLRFALGSGDEDSEVQGVVLERRGRDGALMLIRWPHAEGEVEVPFTSRHRLENMMAAVAACCGAGLPVRRCLWGVADVVFTPSRGDVAAIGQWVVINDTYNASPAAVRAAVDELVDMARERGGRPVAVLGDMLELGPDAGQFHVECGAYAAETGVQMLWGVGPLSRSTTEGFRRAAQAGQTAGHVETVDDVVPVLSELRPGDVVLFKASRSVRLETMVCALVQTAGRGGGNVAQAGLGDGS